MDWWYSLQFHYQLPCLLAPQACSSAQQISCALFLARSHGPWRQHRWRVSLRSPSAAFHTAQSSLSAWLGSPAAHCQCALRAHVRRGRGILCKTQRFPTARCWTRINWHCACNLPESEAVWAIIQSLAWTLCRMGSYSCACEFILFYQALVGGVSYQNKNISEKYSIDR